MMEASLMEEYYHTPIWDEWNLFPTLSITYLPKAGHVIQFDLDCDRDYVKQLIDVAKSWNCSDATYTTVRLEDFFADIKEQALGLVGDPHPCPHLQH